MNHYIIDGNNLIGKITSLREIQSKDKQASRVQLVNLLNGFFAGKKCNLTLHLDGFANTPLHLSKGKIVYSEKHISDYFIKQEIDRSKSRKLIILVSSDHNLIKYAKDNSCTVLKSEEFSKHILSKGEINQEARALNELERDKSFFLEMFKK
ncbi:MAG: NYN domain-containing protein [Bacteroidota bacterium]